MNDPRNVLLVIVLTLLAGSGWDLWRKNHELDALKETVATEKAAAAAERERVERDQARVAAETVAGWSAAVDYWRNHGGVRVRPAACAPAGGAVPALPGAAAGAARLPAREPRSGSAVDVDAAECEARLNGSVLDALWIVSVKEWIRKQHEGSVK